MRSIRRVLALAVAALAGPVLRTSARTEGMATRVSRAIVLLGEVPADRIEAVASGAFRSRPFRRAVLVDALDAAVRWFDAQPASSREIVVVGHMRRGEVTTADLATVPGLDLTELRVDGGASVNDRLIAIQADLALLR